LNVSFDFAENFECFQIENSDIVIGAVAGESASQVVGDRNTMDAVRVRNRPDDFIGRGVDYVGLSGM
jgi:hypothetical protein